MAASATTPPASDPTPASRTNGDAKGTPVSEPGIHGSPDSRKDTSRDYEGRIRANPDFAWEQVRSKQSAADRAEADLRSLRDKLGGLSSYLESGVSGDLLVQAIREYQTAAADPTIQSALATYRQTGRFEIGKTASDAAGSEDPYLTDTERAMRKELDEVRTHARQLEAQISQQSRNFGIQSLTNHLERTFAEWGITGEVAESVKSKLVGQVQTWETQGEVGRKAIADLQRPEGRETVELLVMRALGRKGLLDLAHQHNLRDGKIRAGLATDGPSQLGTTGDEPPPEQKSVLEAIKAARSRPEILSRYS